MPGIAFGWMIPVALSIRQPERTGHGPLRRSDGPQSLSAEFQPDRMAARTGSSSFGSFATRSLFPSESGTHSPAGRSEDAGLWEIWCRAPCRRAIRFASEWLRALTRERTKHVYDQESFTPRRDCVDVGHCDDDLGFRTNRAPGTSPGAPLPVPPVQMETFYSGSLPATGWRATEAMDAAVHNLQKIASAR